MSWWAADLQKPLLTYTCLSLSKVIVNFNWDLKHISPGNIIILPRKCPLNLYGISSNPRAQAGRQALTAQISLFSSGGDVNVNDGRRGSAPAWASALNRSCLSLFNVRFLQSNSIKPRCEVDIFSCIPEADGDKNQINLIKYEWSWETIWNASVQSDKQDWVEVRDLDPRCACAATSYWLGLHTWTQTQLWPVILPFQSCPLCLSSSADQKTAEGIIQVCKCL